MQKITPFLWFDRNAEEAANYYVSIFKDSKLGRIARYTEEAAIAQGMPIDSVLAVTFDIEGIEFIALNGGPYIKFNESISFVVKCDSQKEVDYYWEKLSEGGDENFQQCGWLKDKYGVTWQVVPNIMNELMQDPDLIKAARVTKAMMQMKKIEIDGLKKAYNNEV